jgi:hypothetical protein
MREVELEQPIFGANFIKGKVHAEQGGGPETYTCRTFTKTRS